MVVRTSAALPEPQLLPERIAASLREAIVAGELGPGTHLVEQDIARRFAVSRVPLREAFRVLAGEGLVTIHPHRGAMVSQVSDVELIELFSIRALLEGHAASKLASLADGPVLERLDTIIADMKSAVRRRRLEIYYALAADFHDYLVRASGGGVLEHLYGQIRRQLRRYQAVMARLPESPSASIREHTEIVEAIRRGDADAAEKSAKRHVGALVDRYRDANSPTQAKHGHREVA